MTLCKPKMVQQSEGPIHSGHFMLSEVHRDQENDEEFEANEDNPQFRRRRNSVYKYVRGNVTFFIDRTLNNLFRCLDLAYSGKIPSPRWNIYKDLKLTVKDCIRLNNLIWREWFKQSLLGHKPIVCNLSANKFGNDRRPDNILLEGKYWRRSNQSIQEEYRRWRLPSVIAKKCRCRNLSRQCSAIQRTPERGLNNAATSQCSNTGISNNNLTVPLSATAGINPPTPLSMFCDYDDDDNMWVADFSDTLFANLCNNMFEFPDPKALGQLGNADLIQPHLMPLQPLSELSPKTPPFLCDLQPVNPVGAGSSSWQPEVDSTFLSSFTKQSGRSSHQDAAPIMSSGPFEPASSQPTSSGGNFEQRVAVQINSNLGVGPQYSIGTDSNTVIYQQMPPMPSQISANSYGANASQPYIAPVATAHQSDPYRNRGRQPQEFFMPASANPSPFVQQRQADVGPTTRRRHRSGLDEKQQQQQQQQHQQPDSIGYNANSNSNSSSLARYNPTVASLLQSNSSNSTDTILESYGKSFSSMNNHTRNNSNLMLLSAAASVCSSSTLAPAYVDSLPSTSLTPHLLNSNQEVVKAAGKNGSVLKLSTSKSQSVLPQNSNDIPVVLSAIQPGRGWSQPQQQIDSILNNNGPLTPMSAEAAASGLPPKKRPRNEQPSHPPQSCVLRPSEPVSTHRVGQQYPVKVSQSLAGDLTPSSSLTSSSTNNQQVSVLQQRLKFGNQVPPAQTPGLAQSSFLANLGKQEATAVNVVPSDLTPSSSNARRRYVHIVCESRRRNAITAAMERLGELLPESYVPQNKSGGGRGRRSGLSQAALLSSVAQYLDQLNTEVAQLSTNVNSVRDEIDEISLDVTRLQSSLPLVGACKPGVTNSSSGRFGNPAGQRSRALSRFDSFAAKKSKESWKFVLLNNIFKPLYPAFLEIVKIDIIQSSNSPFNRTIITDEASLREWIAQACSLPALRQASSQLLLELARTSPILVAPSQLPAFLIQQSIKR